MTYRTEIMTIEEISPYRSDAKKFKRMGDMLIAIQGQNYLECVQPGAVAHFDFEYQITLTEIVDEWSRAVRAGFICC